MKKEKGKKNPMGMNEHWQMDVSASVFPNGKKDNADSWLAKRPTEWPTPHKKVNECDY